MSATEPTPESEYSLYRVDWEERELEGDGWETAYAFVASKEPINVEGWSSTTETRNATCRVASGVEEEAYQAGFEDGFDVATVQYRLAEMKKPLPEREHGCLCGND